MHQRKRDAALVGLAQTQLLQDGRTLIRVVAIDQNSVIFASAERHARLVGVVAHFKFDICHVQDAAHGPVDFSVAAEEES